jgi:hypothetical protein
LVWRIRKKISQIINDYLYLPFFLLIILWGLCSYDREIVKGQCHEFFRALMNRQSQYSIQPSLFSVIRGLEWDDVCLCWPIARSYMSPNAGGGGVAGSQPMSTAVHRSPNKLWRSNAIFNLWM